MKKTKIALGSLSILMGLVALSGCSSGEKIKIGILQPVDHIALSSARLGFIEGLKEKGFDDSKVEIIYRNAGGKSSDITSFAKDLVGRCDMTFGIATGAAQSLLSAAIDKGIANPILFSAVTDPVGSNLVKSLENGSGFVTGTSDINPVEDQISLIKECIPAADKVGILYTQTETNSVVQANMASTELAKEGIECVVKTATGPSDISATASALASEEGIDAIYIPTDNNIASNPSAVKAAVQGKGILVVTGEEALLAGCGSVTLSVNYTELGKRTGEMAAQILNKEKTAGEIPVGFMGKDECEYVMCSANAAAAGIELPESVISKCRDLSE